LSDRNLMILGGISAAAFLSPFTQTAYTPSLVEIGEHFDVGIVLINMTISAYVIVLALSGLVIGPMADRLGRRAMLLPGLVIFMAGSLLCLLAEQYSLFLLGRIIQAFGIGAGVALAPVVIGDIYPPEQRANAMSIFQLMTFLGPVLGPVVGGVIAASLSWQSVFGALILGGLIVLTYNALALPETLARDTQATKFSLRAFGAIFADRSASSILLVGFSQFYGQYTFLVFLPILLGTLYDFSAAEKGLAFVPLTAGIILGIAGGKRWLKHWARTRTVTVASFAMAAIALLLWGLLLAGALAFPVLLVILLAYGMLLGGSIPAQTTILVNLFAAANRGTALGVYNFTRFSGAALGPLVGGLVAQIAGTETAFLVLGLALLVAAWIVQRQIHDPYEGSTA
jgi:DHA1 family bicyclomycin/chloramphenicol resistance-like MFS transporter